MQPFITPKSVNVMKQFFIFTFHGKCTCVKLCFIIFRNYGKRTQVSIVFLYSNIMVNAHVKLCHSWKKISLMPETKFLELFLLYQHLRKQKWNLKNIIRILFLLEMNILMDFITINCFKCQKQNNPKNVADMNSFFFLISNKTSLIIKKRHPSTQGVYKGEQIKNENYKSQVNPK